VTEGGKRLNPKEGKEQYGSPKDSSKLPSGSWISRTPFLNGKVEREGEKSKVWDFLTRFSYAEHLTQKWRGLKAEEDNDEGIFALVARRESPSLEMKGEFGRIRELPSPLGPGISISSPGSVRGRRSEKPG